MTDSTQERRPTLPSSLPQGIGISSGGARTPAQLAQARESLKRQQAHLQGALRSFIELVRGPCTEHPWPELQAQRDSLERDVLEHSEQFKQEVNVLIENLSDEETKSALRQIQATLCATDRCTDEPSPTATAKSTQYPA